MQNGQGKRITKQGGLRIEELDSDEEESEESEESKESEESEEEVSAPKQQPKKRAAEPAASTPAKKIKTEPQQQVKKEQTKKTPASTPAKAPEVKKTPAKAPEAKKTPAKTPEAKKTPAKPAVQKLSGGVLVQEVSEGKGHVAKNGKRCGMYYRGTLQRGGKQFDANMSGKPFQFRLGAGEVIQGWDVGVQGMKVGGRRRITVPAHMGYGSQRIPGIPPNSTLIFDVELKSIN